MGTDSSRSGPRVEGHVVSRRAVDGVVTPAAEVTRWLRDAAETTALDLRTVPFEAMGEWGPTAGTGDLTHRSGRFFGVHGLHVRAESPVMAEWYQPIISQPRVGVLGILVRRFAGVPHLLLRARTEPGTADRVQVCPTVATTRDRFVAAGLDVPYLEHFTDPGRGRALVDVLQSEQGEWFLHKRNRVMLVETTDQVEATGEFRWLTLGQVERLLRTDTTLNMDTRGIIGCLGRLSDDPSRSPADPAVLGWITELRTRYALTVRRAPLRTLPGWEWGDAEIRRRDGDGLRILAVSVRSSSGCWQQPLLAPSTPRLAAFVCRHIDAVPHVLARARVEPGFRDTVELRPTVQCALPASGGPPDTEQPYAAAVLGARGDQLRYDQVQAEEGNRFHRALTRYVVADLGDDVPLEVPAGYRWLTLEQWAALLRHGGYVNVQARSLLAALPGVWSGR